MRTLRGRSLARGGIAAAVAALIIAVLVFATGSSADPLEVILTSSDQREVAEAIDEFVLGADADSMRQLVAEAGSGQEVQARVEKVRDDLIVGMGAASPEDRIRILGALAAVDDGVAATVLVGTFLTDGERSVREAAAELIPTLERALEGTLEPLIDARSGAESPDDEAQIEELLRAIGDPAAEAVAALRGRPRWTLDFLVAVGGPLTWLEDLATSPRLGDLQLAADALARIERTDAAAAAPLWQELARSVRGKVSPDAFKARQVADILRNIERVRTSLARPIQRRQVDVLLPRLGSGRRATAPFIPDFALAEALARLGKPAVDKLLPIARQRPGFGVSQAVINRADDARNVLVTMVRVDRDALKPLFDALMRRDHDLIADLMFFYVALGRHGSEKVLIEAQHANGDSQTVIAFLESGRQQLVNAAHAWAANNGFTITGSIPGPGSWGSARRQF